MELGAVKEDDIRLKKKRSDSNDEIRQSKADDGDDDWD